MIWNRTLPKTNLGIYFYNSRYDLDWFDMINMVHLSKWDIIWIEIEMNYKYAISIIDIMLSKYGLTLQQAQVKLNGVYKRLKRK